MIQIFVYAVVSLLIAMMGKERKIGFWTLFAISFVFTPLVGLIVGLCSPRNQGVN